MSEDRKYGGGERKPLGPAPSWEQILQRNSIERLKQEKPLHTFLDELDDLSTRHYLEIPEEDIVAALQHPAVDHSQVLVQQD